MTKIYVIPTSDISDVLLPPPAMSVSTIKWISRDNKDNKAVELGCLELPDMEEENTEDPVLLSNY